MIRGVYLLPNLFTMGNLFCGFFAIISAIKGDYGLAATAIIVANLFDILDGKVARMMNATSRFGMEFDSLADLVSFGVAPGLLIFLWSLSSFGRLGWLAAFLFVACGALRLARYNVQAETTEKGTFNGLPIPAAASMAATTVLICEHIGATGIESNVVLLLLCYGLAFLMVSNVKYPAFKESIFSGRAPFVALVMLAVVFIVVAAEPQISLFFIALIYTLSGPVKSLLQLTGLMKKRTLGDEEKSVPVDSN
ncbi:MAG TPA: CDP-diacylglycerol--serine O-phosphatidyltransferase [Desulfarculaceae bacterium]|nr:CDP-diacylglycerol--serine O-phosphatidyltransferase [Desulfarculaceae bacterium]